MAKELYSLMSSSQLNAFIQAFPFGMPVIYEDVYEAQAAEHDWDRNAADTFGPQVYVRIGWLKEADHE